MLLKGNDSEVRRNTLLIFFFIFIVGLCAAINLKTDLFPETSNSSIKVTTVWPSASVENVVAEIIIPQEEILESIQGIEQIKSISYFGKAEVIIDLKFGVDSDKALNDVVSALSRVRRKPISALPPVVDVTTPSDSLAFLFIQYRGNDGRRVEEFEETIRRDILQPLMKLEDVAYGELFLASNPQLEIELNLIKMANLQLDIDDILTAIKGAKIASSGIIERGGNRISISFDPNVRPDDFGSIILMRHASHTITLSEVAEISIGMSDRTHLVNQNSFDSVGIKLLKSTNASLLSALKSVNDEIENINGVIKSENLHVAVSYDPTVFISRSFVFLFANLLLGIFFASACLYAFIPVKRLCFLIGISVPFSIISCLSIFYVFEVSLNILSIAGLAFASGMILDSSLIVVNAQKNNNNLHSLKAIRSALFSGALTTLLAFTPILFLKGIEGELFSDIAFAISGCIVLSVAFSLYLLPKVIGGWDFGAQKPSFLDLFIKKIIHKFVCFGINRSGFYLVFSLIILMAILLVSMPIKTDYMPDIRRNSIETIINVPPGLSMNVLEQEYVAPIATKLAGFIEPNKTLHLKNFYIVVQGDFVLLSVRTEKPGDLVHVSEFLKDQIFVDVPNVKFHSFQGALFGSFDSIPSIELDLHTADVLIASKIKKDLEGLITKNFKGTNIRMYPSENALQSQLQFSPNKDAQYQTGITNSTLRQISQIFGSGLYADDLIVNGESLQVLVTSDTQKSIHEKLSTSIWVDQSSQITLSELFHIENLVVPSIEQRINGFDVFSLNIAPASSVPLGEIYKFLLHDAVPELEGKYNIKILFSNSFNKLNDAFEALKNSFFWVLILIFVVLMLYFKSLFSTFFAWLSIPFSIFFSLVALTLIGQGVNLSLDLMALIGLIITVGLSVNNSILLMDTLKNELSKGLDLTAALEVALLDRALPIVQTTITTLLGILPIALFPVTGSEIYQGISIVICCGVLASAFYSLFVLPQLLHFFGEYRKFSKSSRNFVGKFS